MHWAMVLGVPGSIAKPRGAGNFGQQGRQRRRRMGAGS